MLISRILGAFTFRKDVYAEVEFDSSFTKTAWILVAVVAFLNQLGSFLSASNWLVSTIVGTILAVLGFALAAWIVTWVGRAIFFADVGFDELVRTLGLAYVWQGVGILGIVTAFSDSLSWVFAPVQIIAAILMLAAWLIAAQEALDLKWVQAIVAVALGWLAYFVITAITGGLALALFQLALTLLG
ncbi:MAG: hypothetical protein PVF47_20895 [Anaerolineae bacterium]|jgi:hypothetical protein